MDFERNKMIPEQRIKDLILEALKNVKDSEAVYQNLELSDETIILGNQSPFDSIAFTAFATDFEEKMEDEIGEQYVLNLEEIFSLHGRKTKITVKELAKLVNKLVGSSKKL